MSAIKNQQSLTNLGKALSRLNEALQIQNPDQLYIDGTIQRFEFALELYWKTLKRLLATEGIETDTPKATLKEAYQIGWLHDETAWLKMLEDRNLTSHVYDETIANRIFQDIKKYFPEMQLVFQELITRFSTP
jgi:nucleotidyltransferase substrate binding protein (TIGR01987 family)